MATAAAAAVAAPGLLSQVGMAGGAAVITVTFIHPIDVVKTRIQISSEYGALGMGGTVKKVVGDEGVSALWKGVNAAWLREASYTSLRLGLYEPVKVMFGASDAGAPFYKKFLAGSAAGAIGSLAGNPFDVLKTKMMASSGKEVPSMVATAKDLFANQGIGGFYRGIDSNIARAMVLNGTKMACYDQAKGYVVEYTGFGKKSLVTQFLSAVTAGFFHDMYRITVRYGPYTSHEPTCRQEDLQQRLRLYGQDRHAGRTTHLLAWFPAHLVTIRTDDDVAIDHLRTDAWNDGNEVDLSLR